ncbi:hypothetical protein [Blastopirellula marina]|uniref:Uncharacterized protein n=1 Tax=Blastopirellula marina TaxID=124 RepID=A0A2S8GG96_9BACT|nr:hypothetical protein [Blastopirellula marina]PQO43485.1 hypothetical protein C5Y93_22790 [Blastopirellula marina]
MPILKRRDPPLSFRLLRLALSVCACLTAVSSAAAQYADTPIVPLSRSQITETFYDGSILAVGVIKELEYTGKQDRRIATVNTDIEVNLTLEIDRLYCGPETAGDELTIRSVWFRPRRFLDEGVPTSPEVGQRIFYLAPKTCYSPEDEVWTAGKISPASDDERETYDRVFDLLASDDGPTAVAQLEAGCFSRDPQFASWCLNILTECHGTVNHARPPLLALISPEIPRRQVIALYWRVLQNGRTPHGAYETADRELASISLSEAEMELRHECHLRRLDDVIHDVWPDVHDTAITSELGYILRTAYPKMPARLRIEALEKGAELAGPSGPKRFQATTLYSIPYLAKPATRDDALRQAQFGFYQNLSPPDASISYAYFWSLRTTMRDDSLASGKLCHEGLSLMTLALVAGNERNAYSAAQQFSSYCSYCQSKKIEWEALLEIAEELRDATPHRRARDRLSQSLEQWGVKEKPLDES